MSRPSVQFNDYVSLAVMLLMLLALVAGQADAGTDRAIWSDPVIKETRLNLQIDAEPSHFRSEDE